LHVNPAHSLVLLHRTSQASVEAWSRLPMTGSLGTGKVALR
jgi:hypothetical protein